MILYTILCKYTFLFKSHAINTNRCVTLYFTKYYVREILFKIFNIDFRFQYTVLLKRIVRVWKSTLNINAFFMIHINIILLSQTRVYVYNIILLGIQHVPQTCNGHGGRIIMAWDRQYDCGISWMRYIIWPTNKW